jgi:DNA polymerase III delta prime subunit
MVAASEGTFLTRASAEALTKSCKGDIRKCINMLEYNLSRSDLKFSNRVPLAAVDSFPVYPNDDQSQSDHFLCEALRDVVDKGEFHDQGDAKWIVIRRSLWGHNDTPSAAWGLAGRRA